jgi:uncharacterized protein
MKNAGYWINHLSLQPHPEGGYFKETYRAGEKISETQPNILKNGARNLVTSIYFLLQEGDVSHFHQLKSDEIWYFHAGKAISVYVITVSGKLQVFQLGPEIEKGEKLQLVIPKGSIFGAVCNEKNSYGLFGCVVSPGFDFDDFYLFTTSELLEMHPHYENEIRRLTKEAYLF